MKDLEPKLGQMLIIKNDGPHSYFYVHGIDHANRLTFLRADCLYNNDFSECRHEIFKSKRALTITNLVIPTDYIVAYRQLRVRKGKVN